MDEDRIEKIDGFDALKRNLDRMLAAVAAFTQDKVKAILPEAQEGE